MKNKNENLTELGKINFDQKHFKKFRDKITSTEKVYYEAEKVYIEAKKAYSEAKQDYNTEHQRYFLALSTKLITFYN